MRSCSRDKVGKAVRRHPEDLVPRRGGRRDGLGLAARGGSATSVGASCSTPPPAPKSLVQIKIEELTEVRNNTETVVLGDHLGRTGSLVGGYGDSGAGYRSPRLLAGQLYRGRRASWSAAAGGGGELGWQRRAGGGKLWPVARMCGKAATGRRARLTEDSGGSGWLLRRVGFDGWRTRASTGGW
jgi:hypothetical protein